MQLQQTIAKQLDFVGTGVHTNEMTAMSIHPAEANHGIRFVRTDVPNCPVILASPHNVADTLLASSLAVGDVQVLTIEHLMSAFWGLGIDNALVTLNNKEIPILDGSAAEFVKYIESVGTEDCNAPRVYLKINEEIKVRHDDCSVSLHPYDGFKASYTFDHVNAIFDQFPKFAEVDFNHASFSVAVAGARSFGLESELDEAQAVKRCLGSSLHNAIGLNETGVMNAEGLRYPDEFVKHKILDAIGDLYLLGLHVIGEFRGVKSGHTLNNLLARAVLRCPEKWDIINLELNDWGALQEQA